MQYCPVFRDRAATLYKSTACWEVVHIPIQKLNKICGYIAGAFILIGAIILLYDTISRYIFHSPSLYASFIVAFLTLGAIFIGAGYSFQAGGQVYIEILVDKLKPLPRKICMTIGNGLGMVFLVALLIECGKATSQAFQGSWVATGNLAFPLFILYGVMVFGCALMAISLVMHIITLWTKKDVPKEDEVKEEVVEEVSEL